MDPYTVREIVMVSQSLSIDTRFVTLTAINLPYHPAYEANPDHDRSSGGGGAFCVFAGA